MTDQEIEKTLEEKANAVEIRNFSEVWKVLKPAIKQDLKARKAQKKQKNA